jgi:ATP-dependent RNA helicase DDX18/HAS1
VVQRRGPDDRGVGSGRRLESRGPVESVSDVQPLTGDGFRFRSGDANFSRPAGLRSRFARRSYEEEEEEGGEVDTLKQALLGYADEEEEEDEDAPEETRPERGTAEARARVGAPPTARLRGSATVTEVTGRASEPDEDLSSFRPRVTTRAAPAPGGAALSFFAGCEWADLGVGAELCAALAAIGAARPSHVQASAWKALSAVGGASPHVAITDAAGSGKTLAYLVPLLAQLRAAEAAGAPRAGGSAPRVVVLAPTAELCAQILATCRALSASGVRLRSCAMTGGHAARTQVEALKQGVDVLVATPGRLATLVEGKALRLSDCRALVLDEADVLAGPNSEFTDALSPILGGLGNGCRRLLVTATLPEETQAHLRAQLLGGAAPQRATGPGLHKPSAGLEECLVDCSPAPRSGGSEDNSSSPPGMLSERAVFRRKAEALVRVLCSSDAATARVPCLVFCNTLEKCRDVENYLRRRDRTGARFALHALHAAISPPLRQAALEALRAPPAGAGAPTPVVVATDRASRGLDCAAVGHVVLFDFPRDPSEYVRRVGRTARGAGGTGRVTALVLGPQVGLARQIMERNAEGQALL